MECELLNQTDVAVKRLRVEATKPAPIHIDVPIRMISSHLSHLLTLLPIFPCIPVCFSLTSPTSGFFHLLYLHDFYHLRHFLLIFLQYLLLTNPHHQRMSAVKAK